MSSQGCCILTLILHFKLHLGRRKLSKDNGLRQKESEDLMQETATETLSKVKEPTHLFDKAKTFLVQKKMVVISGVQGSGKTFLAKSLVHSLQKHGMKMDSIWICSLDQLHQTPSGKEDVFIIDGIFFELQLYENFKETLDALNNFLGSGKEMYIIITMPSYTWTSHCYELDHKFYNVHVDLDKREESEKLTILQFLKAQYNVSSEVSAKLSELQNDLLVASFACIGFPALVSWMCKQPSVENLEKCLNYPLQIMREEISLIKKAKPIGERGKFLVLSYMCLKDGKMDGQNVDRKLFDSLKKKYAPEFEDKDLAKYCEGMVGYYLLIVNDGCYEFDMNIVKKIVFVSLAKDSTKFVKDNCKNDYLKYVIKKSYCPRVMDNCYTECFTRI